MSSKCELIKLRYQAESLALAGNWGQEAIEINTKILEINEHEPGAHTRLAQCFVMKGEYFRAYEIYRNVLTFDPTNKIARNQAERIKEDAHRQKKEIEKDARIEQEKKDILAINNYHEAYYIGLVAKRRKRFDLAIAFLLKATELNPDSPFAWNVLGSAYRHKRNVAEALRAFQKAHELGGGNVSLVGIATVERMMGNFETAIELFKKVLGQDPNNVYALNGLAAAYHGAGKLEEAQNFFDCAFAVKQSNSITNAVNDLNELGRTSKLNPDFPLEIFLFKFRSMADLRHWPTGHKTRPASFSEQIIASGSCLNRPSMRRQRPAPFRAVWKVCAEHVFSSRSDGTYSSDYKPAWQMTKRPQSPKISAY